jgi:hypothetical protein
MGTSKEEMLVEGDTIGMEARGEQFRGGGGDADWSRW